MTYSKKTPKNESTNLVRISKTTKAKHIQYITITYFKYFMLFKVYRSRMYIYLYINDISKH